METVTFDRLLLKTAFCCMASDGYIDDREITLIKKMCDESPLFSNFEFEKEINELITKLNTRGKEFIKYYFELLKNANLSEKEELELINFAVKTINADELVEYAEIKFFKVIRHSLKISDEKILEVYPDIETWLEDDIITDSFLTKITNQYLDIIDFTEFETICVKNIDNI